MLTTALAESPAPARSDWNPPQEGRPEIDMPEMKIETRFGPISVDADRLVDVQGGLLGFPGRRKFALAPIPDERLDRFMLLQSIEDSALSFIVVPLAADAGLVEAADIAEVCATTGTDEQDALIVLIVTVRKAEGGIRMTANLRAPVVVDTRRLVARQCIFSNSRYPIQQAL